MLRVALRMALVLLLLPFLLVLFLVIALVGSYYEHVADTPSDERSLRSRIPTPPLSGAQRQRPRCAVCSVGVDPGQDICSAECAAIRDKITPRPAAGGESVVSRAV